MKCAFTNFCSNLGSSLRVVSVNSFLISVNEFCFKVQSWMHGQGWRLPKHQMLKCVCWWDLQICRSFETSNFIAIIKSSRELVFKTSAVFKNLKNSEQKLVQNMENITLLFAEDVGKYETLTSLHNFMNTEQVFAYNDGKVRKAGSFPHFIENLAKSFLNSSSTSSNGKILLRSSCGT